MERARWNLAWEKVWKGPRGLLSECALVDTVANKCISQGFSEEVEDTIKRFKELQKRSKLQSSRGDPRYHAIFREFQKRSIWGRIWSWENFRPCKTLFLEECSCQIEEGSKDWRGICHVISRREGFREIVICCWISSLEKISPHKTRLREGCDCWIEESCKHPGGICHVISRFFFFFFYGYLPFLTQLENWMNTEIIHPSQTCKIHTCTTPVKSIQ